MKFNDAVFLIEATLERIKGLYGEPMFDEWLIIDFRGTQGTALYYAGPRRSEFDSRFHLDMEGLKGLFTEHDYQSGNFEFAKLSVSTRYDAAITIAPRIYLIFNHTAKGMFQIRQKQGWINALVPFIELADKFQRDPLSL